MDCAQEKLVQAGPVDLNPIAEQDSRMVQTHRHKAVEFFLPPELQPFEADLRLFIDMMVLKLRLNSAKGFAEGIHPVDMLNMLDAEFVELRKALLHESQEAVLAEAADVANFAWLTALAAIRMPKPEYKETQPGAISK